MAPSIDLPIPKSQASASLLVEVILNNYLYHLPLYRQSNLLKGHGLTVCDRTLGYWVMTAAKALAPLGEAFFAELSRVRALQVDETPVKVLEPNKKGCGPIIVICQAADLLCLTSPSLEVSGMSTPDSRHLLDCSSRMASRDTTYNANDLM